MKTITLAILLLPTLVWGQVASMEVNAATSEVGTTMTTDSECRKDFRTKLRLVKSVCVDNGLATTLVIACTGSLTVPSDTDDVGIATNRVIVRAGKTACLDDANLGNVCYVKGRATASTGTYVLTLFGN